MIKVGRFSHAVSLALVNETSAGSATPSMPTGALGIWYMDQAVAASRGQSVPNAATGDTASTNLFAFPRRMFGETDYWGENALTITDANATGADGAANSASTVSGAAGNLWYLQHTGFGGSGANDVVGTYTIAINARWKGTNSASFRLGEYWSSSFLSVTAGDTLWHRYSKTFTYAGADNGMWPMFLSPDGTSAGDWEIDFFNFFPGSSDLGPVGDDGHVYFTRRNMSVNIPAVSSGVYDFNAATSDVIATVSLPTPQTLSAFTVSFCGAMVGDGGNAEYTTVISKAGQNFTPFCIGTLFAGKMGLYYAGGERQLEQSADLFQRVGGGFFTGSISYDGSTLKYYRNGKLVNTLAGSWGSVTVQDLNLGSVVGINTGFQMSSFALYGSALSDAQQLAAHAALSAHATTAGVTMAAAPTKFVAFEGDSITNFSSDTYGKGAGGYAHRVGALANVYGCVRAVSGSRIADLVARAGELDALIPANKNGVTYELFVFPGANDLGGFVGDLTTFMAAYPGYLDARRAAGWDRIAVGTIIDRTLSVSSQSLRNSDVASANATIAGWVGTRIEAKADFAANAAFIPDGAHAGDTTYYPDALHPSTAGHVIMAPIAAATL